MALLTMYDFVTSHIDHLENIGLLNSTNLPNIDTFLVYIWKVMFVNLEMVIRLFYQKSSKIGKLSSLLWSQLFKILNFAWNKHSQFLWSDRLTLFISRKSLADTWIWMTTVCLSVILSNKNSIPWKWAVQLNSPKESHECFSWPWPWCFCVHTNISPILPVLPAPSPDPRPPNS